MITLQYINDSLNWKDFPEGRARFAGIVRGFDELGHEVYALELGGIPYYGEITQVFLANGNDYNIEVISFGYLYPGAAGIPFGIGNAKFFRKEDIDDARSLIIRLVRATVLSDMRPTLLDEFDNAHFMGEISFRDGWAAVENSEAKERFL